MVSHYFIYQLVLCALIWLFILLHCTRSKPGMSAPVTPAEPAPLPPKRHRSREPKPFEGLTQKPPCALCERDTTSPQPLPPAPPDPMPSTNRRPREVDTSLPFCPHAGCDYRGWLGLGNLRANGPPSGGPWRQFHCTACRGYFLETHGTIFHGKQAAVEGADRIGMGVGLLHSLGGGTISEQHEGTDDLVPPLRLIDKTPLQLPELCGRLHRHPFHRAEAEGLM
jgi:hypothetical protein